LLLGFGTNEGRVQEVLAYARKLGRRASARPLDAADPDAIKAWVQGGIEEFGRVDILANCLGWKGHTSFILFTKQERSAWRKCIDIELMAAIYLSDAVIHHMIANQYGRIITIGSDSSKVGETGAAASSA